MASDIHSASTIITPPHTYDFDYGQAAHQTDKCPKKICKWHTVCTSGEHLKSAYGTAPCGSRDSA